MTENNETDKIEKNTGIDENSNIAPVEGLPVVEMPTATTTTANTITFNETKVEPVLLTKPPDQTRPTETIEPTKEIVTNGNEVIPSPLGNKIQKSCLLDTKSGICSIAKLEEACHLTQTDIDEDTQGTTNYYYTNNKYLYLLFSPRTKNKSNRYFKSQVHCR